MIVRRRTLVRVLLASLILAAILVVAPVLFTPEGVKEFFLQQVEAQIGRDIDVGEIRFELLPSIKLTLSDVVIRDEDPADTHFRAKHIVLVLRAWPLLRLQVVGKRLLIDQPQIELRRDGTGRWHLIEIAPGSGTVASGMGHPLAVLLSIRESRIKDGEISVVDEFRPDGVRRATLTALNLTLTSRPHDQSVDLALSAGVPSPRGTTGLSLLGKVSRFESPAGLDPGLGGSQPPEGLMFDGTAEAVDLDVRQLADFFGPRPVPDRVAGLATLRGHIRVTPGMAGYDMVLSDMRGEVEHLALAGQASLSGLLTPQPTFALTFASSPVSLADLLARFPLQWLDARFQEIVVERRIQGIVEVVSATVSGTTGPDPRLSFTGQFRIRQGRALVGDDRVQAQDLEATVFVEPDRIRVADLTGLYGALRVRGGSAIVFLQEDGPWVEMDLTGDMSAPDLAVLLVRSMDPSAFTDALTRLREVAGASVLTFRLAGSPTQPGGFKFLGGEFVLRDIRFRTPALPERVEGLNGRVRVAQDEIELERLIGTIGRTRVEVQGTILTSKAPVLKDFFVLAIADAEDLAKVLPQGLAASLGLEGAVGARLALSGNPKAPQVRAVLDFREAAVALPSFKKPVGTPALLEFEGNWAPDGVVTAKRLELTMPPIRVAGSGTLRTGPTLSVDASFVTSPVALAHLPPGIRIAGLDGGTLEVSLDVKGKGRDWRRWSLGGWIALTDGHVTVQGLDAPLTNLYLRVKLVRRSAELKQLSFQIGDYDLRASGVIQNWAHKPSIELKAESQQLDIDLLIPKGARSPIRDAMEELAAGGRLVGTLTINRGLYKHLSLQDVSCRINVADGALDIDRITALSEGGRLAARLVVALPRRKPADGELVFRLSNFPFDRLLKLLEDKTRTVEGTFSASGTLRMNGRDPGGSLRTLEGKAQFLLRDGHIHRGTIVPKIIGILNLPALLQGKVDLAKDGFPFDKISGGLTAVQGAVRSENLVVDSPIMKMSAAGSYAIPADQLDMVVVVSPLGSYSTFLKSIPLFGQLLRGDRKGIDTAIFEVKGPLQDPDVDYKPLDSLATGVKGLAELAFDVLKNTILLPKRLLSSGEDQDATAPAPRGDHATGSP